MWIVKNIDIFTIRFCDEKLRTLWNLDLRSLLLLLRAIRMILHSSVRVPYSGVYRQNARKKTKWRKNENTEWLKPWTCFEVNQKRECLTNEILAIEHVCAIIAVWSIIFRHFIWKNRHNLYFLKFFIEIYLWISWLSLFLSLEFVDIVFNWAHRKSHAQRCPFSVLFKYNRVWVFQRPSKPQSLHQLLQTKKLRTPKTLVSKS